MEICPSFCDCGKSRHQMANFCGNCDTSFNTNDAKDFEAVMVDNLEDNIEQNKLYLLCKPCQSGKTGVVLSSIANYIHTMKDNNDEKRIINFVICDNSLLQTTQTKQRGDDIDEITTIVLSSNSETSNYKDLYYELGTNNKINMVICCGNKRRLDDITEIIKCKENDPNWVFHIWIDEADKTITKKPEKYIRDFEQMSNVEKIVFITATPQNSLKKGLISTFKQLNLVNIDIVHTNKYLLFKDCEQLKFPFEAGEDCIQYTKRYLDNVEQPQIGQVWFIPGLSTRNSHDKMEHMLLLEKHFNVVIKINGVNKTITIMEVNETTTNEITTKINITTHPIILGNENEVSKWLGEFYYENLMDEKKQWKIAITGNICIGRGITIQSERLDEDKPQQCYISRAIYGPGIASGYNGTHSKCKLYQLCARICGDIKEFQMFQKYGPPKVISDHKIFETVEKMEQMTVDIASKTIDGDTEITTRDIHNIWNKNELVEGKDYFIDYEKFTLKNLPDNLDTTSYFTQKFNKLKDKYTLLIKGLHNPFKDKDIEDGYFKSSLTGKKEILNYTELMTRLHGFEGIRSGFAQGKDKDITEGERFRKRLYVAYENGKDGNKNHPIIVVRTAIALRVITANELCKK